jgi:hypothetical protein
LTPDQIDLNALIKNDATYSGSFKKEPPEEAVARRLREEAEATLKRKMVFCTFSFILAIVAIAFAAALYVTLAGEADDRKWAESILSAIVSGLVGFLVGQTKK